MILSGQITRTIESTLQAYINDPEPQLIHIDPPLNMRELASDLNLLPVVLDMGGCYGLRSDGEVFSFTWDEPFQLNRETDVRLRNLVLFQAGKKFPKLEPLVPSRPIGSRDCEFCQGTGTVVDLPADLAKSVLCFCGGLGWLAE
jgi:hypothetical protein